MADLEPSLASISDFMEALLNEIRTAGLRKGRENAIVSVVQDLRAQTKAYSAECKSTLKEWVLFSEAAVSARNIAGKKWKILEDQAEEMHRGATHAVDALKATVEARDGEVAELKEQIKLLQASSITDKEANDVKWMERLTKEIAATKQRLVKDAEKKAVKCVEGVEGEYKAKIAKLKEQLGELKGMLDAQVDDNSGLVAQIEEKDTAIKRLQTFGKEMDDEYASCSKQSDMMLQSAHAENEELLKANNDLRARLAVMKEACDEECASIKNRRKRDLESVETRVREVVKSKEKTIERLMERTEVAERRAAELEKMLNALNDGFEMVEDDASNEAEK
jgi:chromosome segregation ATPase